MSEYVESIYLVDSVRQDIILIYFLTTHQYRHMNRYRRRIILGNLSTQFLYKKELQK